MNSIFRIRLNGNWYAGIGKKPIFWATDNLEEATKLAKNIHGEVVEFVPKPALTADAELEHNQEQMAMLQAFQTSLRRSGV